jgi:hypothetical protein
MKRPAQILTPLRYEDLARGKQIFWIRLIGVFRFYSAELGCEIEVRIGFECDAESTPRLLFSIVPPFGAARPAAVGHDWLYKLGGYYDAAGNFVRVTRLQADRVYRELLLANGMPAWRAAVRYSTLRAAGWKAWNNHRQKEKSLGHAAEAPPSATQSLGVVCAAESEPSQSLQNKP